MVYPKYIADLLLTALFFAIGSFSIEASEKATIIFAAEMTEIATHKKGGYPELAYLLKQYRAKPTPVFFLFGGGSLGPSTLSSLDRGTHIIDLLNSLEPNAMGVAKREFSFYEDELSLRSYEAAFPLVASNLIDEITQENLDGLVENTIVQQGNYRFGVITVLDDSVVEEYALTRIKVTDKLKAIEKQSKLLKQQDVDLIVLLYSHPYSEVSKLLKRGVIDISLRRDEHHTQPKTSDRPNNDKDVLLTQSGKIAIVELEWQEGVSKSLELNWQVKTLSDYPKDPDVLRQVVSYTDRLATILEQKIGVLASEMDTNLSIVRKQESAFANYITDAMIDYTKADIAFINGGSIRGEKIYPANSILTRSDLIRELPFRSKIALLEITGKQVIEALENGFSLIENVKGRFPQTSGIKVIYDSSKKVGERVIAVSKDGKPLQLNKIYRLATTSYLSVGGDGYSVFKNLKVIYYNNQMSRFLSDIVIENIKQDKIITLKRESRLTDVAKEHEAVENER